MHNPVNAQPFATFRSFQKGQIVAGIIGIGKLGNVQQSVPLVRTNQTETLSVIGHVIGIQLGKSIENIFLLMVLV